MDLASVWNTVNKTKTELWKMEHRLDQFERRPWMNLGDTNMTDSTSVLGIGPKDTACRPSSASTATEKYDCGKNARVRKVSRMADKYSERPSKRHQPQDRRTVADESRATHQETAKRGAQEPRQRPRAPSDPSPKRVDFRDRLDYREMNADGTYTDTTTSFVAARGSKGGRSFATNAALDSTLDARDTEVRFLNDRSQSSRADAGGRSDRPKSTRADVGRTNANGGVTTRRYDKVDSSRDRLAPEGHSSAGNDGHSLAGSDSSEKDIGVNPPRRDIDRDSDDFSKLKERIMKQRQLALAKSDYAKVIGNTRGGADLAPNHTKSGHRDDEAVQPKSYDIYRVEEKHARSRKVASGPATPSYRGFTSLDTLHTAKVVDGGKKSRRKHAPPPPDSCPKIQTKKAELPGNDTDRRKSEASPKKMTRVVSSKEHRSKPKQPELITTSSWRAGQAAVLEILGPHRPTKPPKQTASLDAQTKTDKDKPHKDDGRVSCPKDPNSGAGHVISDAAKRVLSDLHLDPQQEFISNNDGKSPKKHTTKRKAPKPLEPEKQPSTAKVRHYDSDEVRQYMSRQKHERFKQSQNDQQRQEQHRELCKKQLAELSARRRDALRRAEQKSKVASGKIGGPVPSDTQAATGSDKENEERGTGEGLNVSEGSSTLTGDDSDTTPVPTPYPNKQPSRPTLPPTTHPSDDKSVKPSETGVNLAPPRSQSVVPATTHAPQVTSTAGSEVKGERSRAERILAIRQCASLLQSRIQHESSRLCLFGSASLPPNATRPPKSSSRAEQQQQPSADYLPLSGSLPATGALHKPRAAPPAPQATIQALPRSWPASRITQAFAPGDSAHEQSQATPAVIASSSDDTSTFSDITYTDDESVPENIPEPLATRRIGTGLLGRDYHADVPPVKPDPPAPRPRARRSIRWDQPEPDPHSVISVLARRTPHHLRSRTTQPSAEIDASAAVVQYAPADAASSKQRERAPSSRSSGDSARVPNEISGVRNSTDDLDGIRAANNASSDNKPSDVSFDVKDIQQPLEVVTAHDVKGNDDEFRTEYDIQTPFTALESRAPTDNLPPDPERTSARDATPGHWSHSESFVTDDVSEKNTPARDMEKLSVKSHAHGDSLDSDLSSLGDERPEKVNKHLASKSSAASLPRQRPTQAPARDDPLRESVPPRYSPDTLERRMKAELNRLESMEVSMIQLVGVERSRGVALAQQETVSLAQIIKARQQQHDGQMRELLVKAEREKQAAAEQLEDARQRTSQAAHDATVMIATLRDQTSPVRPVATRLLESQNEAAKATAVDAKQIKETYGRQRPVSPMSASSSSATSVTGGQQSTQTARQSGRSRDTTRESDVKTASDDDVVGVPHKALPKSPSSSVRTAADSQQTSMETGSNADAVDTSKNDTISEDIASDKGSVDYSMRFDDSMTEDEIEEKSFRMVLPSESHRRNAKRKAEKRASAGGDQLQSDSSVVSDEQSTDRDLNTTHFDEMSVSLFTGEESFHRFTSEMVSQYMKEEELRAQHQSTLLKLREKALKEKTKAELDWLEQQKKRMKNKGADDSYPQVKKKQRGIMLRLQQQQAELRRLQEANKSASKERQLIIRQQEEITRLREATRQKKEEIRLFEKGAPDSVQTEDEIGRARDIRAVKHKKGSKSDSEMHTEPTSAQESKVQTVERFKKLHLNESCLTQREQKLHERRKNAEQLLAWKRKLDEEEAQIYEMERQALAAWREDDPKRKAGVGQKTANDDVDTVRRASHREDKVDGAAREKSVTYGAASVASESVSLAKDSRTDLTAANSEKVKARPDQSGSESSITEEVVSRSSSTIEEVPTESKLIRDDASHVTEYAEDTFVSADSPTLTSKRSAPAKVHHLLSPRRLPFDPLVSPKSPRSTFTVRGRGSESESEDSVSHTETASDQSDVEGRIRALKEELSRRKLQVDRLKKDQKQRQKERLKSQEQSLLKQIDAYDNYIKQCSNELQSELENEPSRGLKPQIKQPRVRDPRPHATPEGPAPAGPAPEDQDASSPRKPRTPQRSESESSRSSMSSSFDDLRDGTELVHTPSVNVHTSPSTTAVVPEKRSMLESISEKTESKSDSVKCDGIETKKERENEAVVVRNVDASVASEVSEEIDNNLASVVYSEMSDFSGENMKLDLVRPREESNAHFEPGDTILEGIEEGVMESGFDMNKDVVGASEVVYKDEQSQEGIGVIEESLGSVSNESGLYKAMKVAVTPDIKEKPIVEGHEGWLDADASADVSDDMPDTYADVPDIRTDKSDKTAAPKGLTFEQTESKLESDVSYAAIFSESSEKSRRESQDVSVQNEKSERDRILSVQEKTATYTDDFSDDDDTLSASKGVTDNIVSESDISEVLSKDADEEDDDATLSEKSECWINLDNNAEAEIGDVYKDVGVVGTGNLYDEAACKDKNKYVKLDDMQVDEKSVRDDSVQAVDKLVSEKLISDKLVSDKLVSDKLISDKSVSDGLDIELGADEMGLLEQTISDVSLTSEDVPEKAISSSGVDIGTFQVDLDKEKESCRDAIVDKITTTLTEQVVRDSIATISDIATKVASDTEQKQVEYRDHESLPVLDVTSEDSPPNVRGGVVPSQAGNLIEFSPPTPPHTSPDVTSDSVMSNLLNEALDHMISIRRRRVTDYQTDTEFKITQDSESTRIDTTTASVEPMSSEIELQNTVTPKVTLEKDMIEELTVVPRPSPEVFRDQLSEQESLNNDLSDLLGVDEYIDDDYYGIPCEPPPPYPGILHQNLVNRFAQEPVFVIPRDKDDISTILTSAVDIFWSAREHGQPLETVCPPATFYKPSGITSQDDKHHGVYQRMLFDLAGEITTDVFDAERERAEVLPPWKKPSGTLHRYGKTPYGTISRDSLERTVQEACVDILGLKESENKPSQKWGVRRKKDRVDHILVQELRQDEPGWVNYDVDELSVKLQLSDTILDYLLSDTSQTLSSIVHRNATSSTHV